jgi:hypothetical protein
VKTYGIQLDWGSYLSRDAALAGPSFPESNSLILADVVATSTAFNGRSELGSSEYFAMST